MGVLSALLGQYAAVDAVAFYVLPTWEDLSLILHIYLPQRNAVVEM